VINLRLYKPKNLLLAKSSTLQPQFEDPRILQFQHYYAIDKNIASTLENLVMSCFPASKFHLALISVICLNDGVVEAEAIVGIIFSLETTEPL
jgi:hypothetical protein